LVGFKKWIQFLNEKHCTVINKTPKVGDECLNGFNSNHWKFELNYLLKKLKTTFVRTMYVRMRFSKKAFNMNHNLMITDAEWY
jgi:hypothetical protein